jgi:hypothetical protein
MSYYFSKTLKKPFAQAIQRVTEALAGKEFGVLTIIDVRNDEREASYPTRSSRIRRCKARTRSKRCYPAMLSFRKLARAKWRSQPSILQLPWRL